MIFRLWYEQTGLSRGNIISQEAVLPWPALDAVCEIPCLLHDEPYVNSRCVRDSPGRCSWQLNYR